MLEVTAKRIRISYPNDPDDIVRYPEIKNLKIITSSDGKNVSVSFSAKNKYFTIGKFKKMNVAAALIERYAGKGRAKRVKQLLPWHDKSFRVGFALFIMISLAVLVIFAASNLGAWGVLLSGTVSLAAGTGILFVKKSN